MKICKFCETLIIAFSLLTNTIFLFSQESGTQKEKTSEESKCLTLVVTPSNQNVTASSGTTGFTVTSNLSWTSSSNQPWCTVTSSGSGNGTITASYQSYTGAGSRVAAITVSAPGVSDREVTVTQTGSAPVLIITPSDRDVTSPAGTTSFDVTSNTSWTASSDQSWCTVTPSGTGNGTITATYQAHTATGTRIAAITVTGSGAGNQIVTVTQSGVPPSLIVTPANQNVTSSPGTATYQVASNIAWTSACDQDWCTVTSSGTDNGTITAVYQANTSAVARVATITVSGPGVSGQTVILTQDELITISYSGSPWCPSAGVQDVTLSGSSGGTYSSQPEGLKIDAATGTVTTNTSAAGSYTVKYTLEKSGPTRVLEATAGVEVYPAVIPQITIKWGDVLICSNVGNLFFGYQWFEGTTPIAGADKQFYLTTKIPGVYTVEATDKNGCKARSNETGIESTKSLLVYPNPATSSFKIGISDIPAGRIRIKINDMAGTAVMDLRTEKSDFENFKEISTDNLDNGMYFVQVLVNDLCFFSAKVMVAK
jgi:Viral BACON domain/Secretion system C-terminal sorting domain/Putative binding domain, N-terminal